MESQNLICILSICPGKYFAADNLFIAFASILQVCDITATLNEDGSEVEFEPRWEPGITV